MKIIYYDRNKGQMRTLYVHPKNRRSAQILALAQPKQVSLHPLDLLHRLISKLVERIFKPRS